MADINIVKKQLKKWESEFSAEHGRKPGKDDLVNAPENVKDLYQQYRNYKKASEALEDRAEVTQVGDVWGASLNKPKKYNSSITEGGNDKKGKTSVLDKYGAKLMQNCQLSLPKNPFKKSTPKPNKTENKLGNNDIVQSPWNSKPKSNVNSTQPFSETSMEFNIPLFENVTKLSRIKHNSGTSQSPSTKSDVHIPVPYIDHQKAQLQKKLSLKSEQLKRFQVKIEKGEYDTILENETKNTTVKPSFEDSQISLEARTPKRIAHIPKENRHINKEISSVESDLKRTKSEEITPSKKRFLTSYENEDRNFNTQRKQEQLLPIDIPYNFDEVETVIEIPRDILSEGKKRKRRAIDESLDEKPVKKSRKKVKTENDGSPNDPPAEPILDKNMQSINEQFAMNEQIAIEENEEELTVNTTYKPKAKRSGPLNNDNFVRLNMKNKSYRRKGKGMSYGALKRKNWKNKMASRSQSFGSGKCFKCGQEGHWANKCTGKKSFENKVIEDIEVVDDTPVNESDFPSLQEAAMMASGVKPKTKPKNQTQKDLSMQKNDDHVDDQTLGIGEDDDFVPMVVRTPYEAPEPPKAIESLYHPNQDGTPIVTPDEVYKALRSFGHRNFRPGQEEAITRIVCGLSTLVVLSTGAGKSLCYQLPAYLYAQRGRCISLVVSPLVSLMEDQITGLPPCVRGACLHTNMTKGQREKVTEAVIEGKVHFLLVSPEALVGGGGSAGGCLPNLSKFPPVAFACIDEAHCVSEWSHHFRPSYLRLCKVLKEKFGVRCFLGLTATATLVTAASVAQHLGIHDYDQATIRGSPVPANLILSVSRDENKQEALLNLLQGNRFAVCDSIIIYCTRREQTDRLATLIRTLMKDVVPPAKPEEEEESTESSKSKKPAKKGRAKKGKYGSQTWTSECYHAGLTAAQRKRVQNAFMSGRLRVVVATVAFGMGLDKPDVRAIIHYNMPKSFESYVQEIGRAGRDGKPAHCHVFLDHEGNDTNELKRHIYGNTVDAVTIKKLVRRIFPACKCRFLHEAVEKKSDDFEEDGVDYSQIDEKDMQKDNPENIEPQISSSDGGSHKNGIKKTSSNNDRRLCPGHERAVPINQTVTELDMKEEGISTLLCYLELHEKHWIQNLQPVYGSCVIQCYGGPRQLQTLATKCPPVAVAIAQDRRRGVSHTKSSRLEFPVVEVSDSMGWDSGRVKSELKSLMWNLSNPAGPRKSGIIVEFTDLAFHLRSPGDLSDDELDEVVKFLTDRVTTQERAGLQQLQMVYDTLHGVSHREHWLCSDEADLQRSQRLRSSILQYFEQQPTMHKDSISKLSFAREGHIEGHSVLDEQVSCEYEDQVRSDIRTFINQYSSEHSLSGRAIARVFHGIASPCFPAEVWGRVRRYWRSYLSVDFNLLRKMATKELINFR